MSTLPKAIVSFGQDNLHKLQTLVNATPNPSPEVLDTWASLFHVSRAVLLHAIHVILVEKAPQDVHQTQIDAEQNALHRLKTGPPIQRLPTPANSLTPEPAPAANDGGSPKFMKNECNTPTLAKATDSGRDMIAQFQQPRDHSSTNFIPAPALHDQVIHSQASFSFQARSRSGFFSPLATHLTFVTYSYRLRRHPLFPPHRSIQKH